MVNSTNAALEHDTMASLLQTSVACRRHIGDIGDDVRAGKKNEDLKTKQDLVFVHSVSHSLISLAIALTMRVKALVALSLAGTTSAGDPYHVDVTNGNFTISEVTMHTPATNDKWQERAVAVLTMTGKSEKIVDAGTLQYQVYEHGVPNFIASGSFS